MKKKKIIIPLVIIVLILVGIIVYTLTNLDSIVKSLIESQGTKAVGTEVSVKGVNISLSKGEATITGLEVANPEGFTNSPMIKFGTITAQVDYKTHAIKNINVGSPYFLFEQKGGRTNFGEVQKYISEKSTQSKESGATREETRPTEKTTESEKTKKEFQIDAFTINNAVMDAVSLDTGDKASASIGKIEFSNLKGTSEEIIQQVFAQLTAQIIQQAANTSIQNVIKQNVKGELGNTINSQINNILGK